MIRAKALPTPDDLRPIQRALLSVFDKADLVPFAERLVAHGVELVSSGGTARALREAGLSVTDVQDVTGVPEILGGRVKTLHPAIHGGLLARRTDPDDLAELEANNFPAIDLVVANLYPFEEVTAQDSISEAEAIENIDIGGPAMVRAAAKNFYFVGVITSPADYETVADVLDEHDGQLPMDLRRSLAHRAFQRTAQYDQAITGYFAAQDDGTESDAAFPSSLTLHAPKVQTLRYGENPHQRAALYGTTDAYYRKLHGKAISFNNLIDLSAALALIDEFQDEAPTCAILKHTNPCGVAIADSLEEAYANAFATDRQSPFGGIVVVNRPLDRPTAEAIDAIFTEIIIAPAYEDGVLDLLMQKKNRRLIEHLAPARTDTAPDVRSIIGGYLVQDRDPVLPPSATLHEACSVVTERPPSESEWQDLDFAWRVCKHVKSNAIVYARDRATLGIGAGQMSRVDASELAVAKGAKSELDFNGSVVASDAFFPFADGLVAAAESGATLPFNPVGRYGTMK